MPGFVVDFINECDKKKDFDDAFIRALKKWAIEKIDIEKDRILYVADMYSGAEDDVDFTLKLEMSGALIKQLKEICEQRSD